jgi:hypothetical protein
VQATADLVSWEELAELWLEGTTNLVGGLEGSSPARYFRARAY